MGAFVVVKKMRTRDGSILCDYLLRVEKYGRRFLSVWGEREGARAFDSVDAAKAFVAQYAIPVGDARTGRWLHVEAR